MTSRRDREKEFKKQLIAEAAYKLFSSSSFEAVTVEDIARQAEFGKGTLYLYFENKEDILVYIFCHGVEELCKDIEDQCSEEPDIEEALNRYMSLQYSFYQKYHSMFLSLLRRKLEGTLNPDQFLDTVHKQDVITDLVAGILARGTREGYIVAVDSRKLARVIRNVLKGFSFEALDRKDIDAEKDLELIKMVLSNGIMVGGGKQ
ncbi:MAG: TetR/AcrR family transcriptional regulator [Syntrophomonas sp.]|nr:TetR/AcrR family transcriptional regulator [Syntrophomonas sp.]